MDAHAEQVVEVHHHGVLCDPFPDREVTRLLPVEISEDAFGAGAVCVHDVHPVGITTQVIGIEFAESVRKEALIKVSDGRMHFFLLCRNAPLII